MHFLLLSINWDVVAAQSFATLNPGALLFCECLRGIPHRVVHCLYLIDWVGEGTLEPNERGKTGV
jgi:hypothetical protein